MLNTQEEFRNYCLRKLGQPVIMINLDQTQVDDAIDDAILKFVEYHRDGYEEFAYVYTFPTEEAAQSRTIDIPADLGIDDIVQVIAPGSSVYGGRFDTYAWQAGAAITSPVSGGWANTSLVEFTTMMQRLSDLNSVLGELFPFRFSKYKRRISLMFKVSNGEAVAFRTYRRIDPRVTDNEYAWNEPWLKSYATALIKERWGNVLIKTTGIVLVGGVQLNGQYILDSAKEEIQRLEEELKRTHQEPIEFMVG